MRDQNSNEESHCAGDYTHSGVLRNEIEKVLPNWLESHSSVEDIINEIGADENGPETPQATNRHSNSIVSYNNRILTDVRDDSSRNREIVFHAATVAQQFRSLVEQKTAIDLLYQHPPSYEDFLDQVKGILLHQHEVNQATSKLTASNYMVNMINYVRCRQLKNMVDYGRRELQLTQQNVYRLEENVEDLQTEVAVQKKISDRIKSSLDATKGLLDKTIIEYRSELARQRDVLSSQDKKLDEILKSKFNQDFIIDATIFSGSIYIAHTYFINYPISFLLYLISKTSGKSRKRDIFIRQFSRFLIAAYLIQKLRGVANDYGVHNRIGGFLNYISSFVLAAGNISKRLILAKKTSTSKMEAPIDEHKNL